MDGGRRSAHADTFNHDPWANDYDADVLNEADPIRAGYRELLAWTLERAAVTAEDVVIDLGIGTGNTVAPIRSAREVHGVDLSSKMIEIAKPKLAHLPMHYHVDDLLTFFASAPRHANVVVSTYAIHHLTKDEKAQLFRDVADCLPSGGRAVFGDLMFESAMQRLVIFEEFIANDRQDLVEDIEEEFFWQLDEDRPALEEAGFAVDEARRFSTLSWGLSAKKH